MVMMRSGWSAGPAPRERLARLLAATAATEAADDAGSG